MAEQLPVTVVMSRRAKPGDGQALLGWAEQMCHTAAAFPGYLDGRVQTVPNAEGEGAEIVTGLSFATGQDLITWEQSNERAACLEAGGMLTAGPPRAVSIGSPSGRLWVAGGPREPLQLSRGMSTFLIWLGLFPPAVLLNLVMETFADSWHIGARTFVMTAVLVPVVVLGTVPLVQRLYARLFSGES